MERKSHSLSIKPFRLTRIPSGLFVPQNAVQLLGDDSAAEKNIGVYTEYSEIYKDTSYAKNTFEHLIGEIKEFNFKDLMQSLAKLNYFLSAGYRTLDKTELELIDDIFPALTMEHTRLLLAFAGRRKIFFRQQVLGLMKINVLKNNGRLGKKAVKDDLRTFARMLFRITDFTEKETNEAIAAAQTEEEKRDALLGSLIRNLGFNSTQQFRYTLTRYWTLYFEIAPRVPAGQRYNVEKAFKEITGLEMGYFMAFAFAIRAYYMNAKKSIKNNPGDFLIGRRFFASIKSKSRRQVNKIFKQLACTKRALFEEIRKEQKKKIEAFFSYKCFWRKPLFKQGKDAYYIIDEQFLEEKLTFGLHGQMVEFFANKENSAQGADKKKFQSERNALNRFVGRCVEIYVDDLFHRIFPPFPKRVFSEYRGDATGNVDLIILYPDTLFFIEVTTKALRFNTILSGDMKDVEAEIKAIFFGTPGQQSKGKIVQLQGAIQSIISGKIDLGIKIYPTMRIYPVIVTQMGFPVMPSLMGRYKRMISEAGFTDSYWNNLQLWDLEELEIIEPILNKGTSLVELIGAQEKSAYKDWFLKNYLYFEKRDFFMENEFLKGQLDKFGKAVLTKLF